MEVCALCPKLCRSECPVSAAEGSETSTPTGLLALVHLARAEQRDLSPAEAEALWHCSGCRGCEPLCDLHQSPADLLHRERARAIREDRAPESVRALTERIRKDGSWYGPDQAERLREATPNSRTDRRGRVLLWPGCAGVEHGASDLEVLLDLLDQVGADHVSLPTRAELPCCGAWLAWAGDESGLRDQARAVEQWFNRQRTLVSPSSACLDTIRRRYPEVGVEIQAELFHITEYLLLFRDTLAEVLAGARQAWIERGGVPTVAFHDPCHLARGRGETDAPRELLRLALGTDPLDLVHNTDHTRCCGGAPGYQALYPETAAAMARAVVEDRSALAATWLVSGDPACGHQLASAGGATEVMDIVGFLVRFLEPVRQPQATP